MPCVSSLLLSVFLLLSCAGQSVILVRQIEMQIKTRLLHLKERVRLLELEQALLLYSFQFAELKMSHWPE